MGASLSSLLFSRQPQICGSSLLPFLPFKNGSVEIASIRGPRNLPREARRATSATDRQISPVSEWREKEQRSIFRPARSPFPPPIGKGTHEKDGESRGLDRSIDQISSRASEEMPISSLALRGPESCIALHHYTEPSFAPFVTSLSRSLARFPSPLSLVRVGGGAAPSEEVRILQRGLRGPDLRRRRGSASRGPGLEMPGAAGDVGGVLAIAPALARPGTVRGVLAQGEAEA